MDEISKELIKFLSGYESPETPQSIDEIRGDFQLAGLMTALNKSIAENPKSLLLDIGCGNGALFAKLSEIGSFSRYPNLVYEGIDTSNWLTKAFENATKLNLLSKVRFFLLENDWVGHLIHPCIVVIRNVFHELSPSQVSELIFNISTNLPMQSSIFIQDMSTLPVSEKGRCGWFSSHIESIFRECGFDTVLTPDTSKKGIDIFLIEGKKINPCKKSKHDILTFLFSARAEQLKVLHLKYLDLQEKPGNTFPFLRLNHDIAAISLQLNLLGPQNQDDKIVLSTFSLAFKVLSIERFNQLRLDFKYPQIPWFQNRSHAIQAIDDFLLNKTPIIAIVGPKNIGKQATVWYSLDKKQHSRLPVFIDLFTGITIFNFLETIATQLDVAKYIDVEILSSIKNFPVESMFNVVKEVACSLAMNTILVLDSFESIIDPDGFINNNDVKKILDTWSSVVDSKIIIQSRSSFSALPCEICSFEYISVFRSRDDSPRFGKFLYSVQMLQEIIPNEYRVPNSDFGGFPADLLESLENHPYLLYVAGMAIKNNSNLDCLSDPAFLKNLKHNLAETLFERFKLHDNERDFLHFLAQKKEGIPLALLKAIFGNDSFQNILLEKGFLLQEAPGYYKALAILKFINNSATNIAEEEAIERKWNTEFHRAYLYLYKCKSDPSYLRNARYHSLAIGERFEVTSYNVAEVSKCAESWYRSKHYEEALWGYQEIKKLRPLASKELMREASCLLRANFVKDGKIAYENLLRKYPNWNGLKNSYIDSLLAAGQCSKEALELLSSIPEGNRDSYWHKQSARCYGQLSKKREAYAEYQAAILSSTNRDAINLTKELISFARENGDNDVLEEWQIYLTRYLN